MKKQVLQFFFPGALVMMVSLQVNAQTLSTLEGLSLSPGSYWNGAAVPLGTIFADGNVIYPNYYDTSWGGYWAGGWAYSNMQDSSTSGYTNMYAAKTYTGYNGSSIYAVGQNYAVLNFNATAEGNAMTGFYVTNGTYAYNSMRDGDAFAKKFGGPTGNDPDWFKLTVFNWYNGVMTNDSVEFYLADFRFSNNAQDYLVDTWEWIDLTSLGNCDSLQFVLSSSDVGGWGMNTPAFFCMDNFTTSDTPLALQSPQTNSSVSIYPSPATDFITVSLTGGEWKNATVSLTDLGGKTISRITGHTGAVTVDLSLFAKGMYIVNIENNGIISHHRILKQ